MSVALKEAKKGIFTHPNPKVGCVIIKNGKIISKGYHRHYGGPHAEVNAINKLSPDKVKNSTVYVTLEPCSTYGKTPPCTELLIKSKVKRVVIGSIDPNPKHNGRAVKILKKHGIEVSTGVLKDECEKLNRVFFKNMKYFLPYITLKIAQSIDGKIADKDYNSKWITSEKSRIIAHKLRRESDCILVGINTVIKDNPSLNIRYVRFRKQPDICVIDRNLRIKTSSNLFKIPDRKIYIVKDRKLKSEKRYPQNTELIDMSFDNNGLINIKKLLKILYKKGIRHILVEGGAFTSGSFLHSGNFDRIIVFISPMIIGDSGIDSFILPEDLKTKDLGLRLKYESFKKTDKDLMIELVKNV